MEGQLEWKEEGDCYTTAGVAGSSIFGSKLFVLCKYRPDDESLIASIIEFSCCKIELMLFFVNLFNLNKCILSFRNIVTQLSSQSCPTESSGWWRSCIICVLVAEGDSGRLTWKKLLDDVESPLGSVMERSSVGKPFAKFGKKCLVVPESIIDGFKFDVFLGGENSELIK